MPIKRILGTDTGKSAFYKADENFVALEKRPILNKTAAYTVAADDLNKTITVTGDTTITLTAIATLGLGFRCRISNIGEGIISLVPSGTDTIAKGTGITIYPGKCVEVVADYAGMWTVVGFDFTEQINNLNAQASKWRRIDTLSAPVEITSTDAMNPNILPISEAYVNSKVYAVEFLLINPDGRISQFAIFGGYSGGSTGGLVVGGNVNAIYTVSKIRTSNSNTIGFYGKSGVGTLGTLYFYKCYVVKESLS